MYAAQPRLGMGKGRGKATIRQLVLLGSVTGAWRETLLMHGHQVVACALGTTDSRTRFTDADIHTKILQAVARDAPMWLVVLLNEYCLSLRNMKMMCFSKAAAGTSAFHGRTQLHLLCDWQFIHELEQREQQIIREQQQAGGDKEGAAAATSSRITITKPSCDTLHNIQFANLPNDTRTARRRAAERSAILQFFIRTVGDMSAANRTHNDVDLWAADDRGSAPLLIALRTGAPTDFIASLLDLFAAKDGGGSKRQLLLADKTVQHNKSKAQLWTYLAEAASHGRADLIPMFVAAGADVVKDDNAIQNSVQHNFALANAARSLDLATLKAVVAARPASHLPWPPTAVQAALVVLLGARDIVDEQLKRMRKQVPSDHVALIEYLVEDCGADFSHFVRKPSELERTFSPRDDTHTARRVLNRGTQIELLRRPRLVEIIKQHANKQALTTLFRDMMMLHDRHSLRAWHSNAGFDVTLGGTINPFAAAILALPTSTTSKNKATHWTDDTAIIDTWQFFISELGISSGLMFKVDSFTNANVLHMIAADDNNFKGPLRLKEVLRFALATAKRLGILAKVLDLKDEVHKQTAIDIAGRNMNNKERATEFAAIVGEYTA